jgi:DNA-binding NtrC family response regulator
MTEDELSSNVLLVDDEEQFLDTLSQRLELRGIKVDTVTGGEEAMDKITAKKFDAIVLDLVMPGIDGMETLKRLKEKNPDIQIIMLTGKATVKKGIEAMKLGAEEFLEKPVDLNVLMEKIKKATHNKMLLVEKSRQAEVKKILKKKGW